MSRKGDGLFPVLYAGFNTFDNDGSSEYCTVQHGTDRTVGALPHFFKIILCHAGCVGCDSGTFYSNTVLLGSICSIHSYLIISLVAMFQAKVVIFCFQIDKRKQKLIFDHLPQDTGHLVAVHLNQRCFHLDLFHNSSSIA